MISCIERLQSVFDDFLVTLEHDTASAVRTLVSDLAANRGTMSAEVWRTCCEEVASHPAFPILLEDPYTHDARTKPAGYPGDARTLDYVYLRRAVRPMTSRGRHLFEVTTGVPIADAVRDRCLQFGGRIKQLLQESANLQVSSLACGHARELGQLDSDPPGRMQFWGMDQDPQTIQSCCERIGNAKYAFEVASVRAVLQGRLRLPPSDFIYASGLFDYLDDRVGSVLLKRMIGALRPGGVVLIANLTPDNHEIAYMEAVMDWWMVYRQDDDLRRLAAAAVDSQRMQVSSYTTSNGRVGWLEVRQR